MKVPYKINLPHKDGKLIGLVKEDGLPFKNVDGNIEYIRKDVVLKYLDEHFSSLMEYETQDYIAELEEYIESL